MSSCALLVDYVLTITVSIASACDQIWNFLSPEMARWKLPAELVVLVFLVILNLRGVRESVTFLAPVFLVFVLTHAFAIVWVLATHAPDLPSVFHGAALDLHGSVGSLGFWPLAFILLRAYSLGGGTYTGIEAVSNGVAMLREPRVRTGKRTMALMAASLAFTAGGILFGYLLVGARPQEGKTMNWVLFDALFGKWHLAPPSSSFSSSPSPRSSSWRRRRVSSTGRASSRTWRSTRGYRTASRSSRIVWSRRTASS